MKRVLLFSVGLVSLMVPITGQAAVGHDAGKPKEVRVVVTEKYVDENGVGSRKIRNADGSSASYTQIINSDEKHFKLIPKKIPGYRVALNEKNEPAISGSVNAGFRVQYVLDPQAKIKPVAAVSSTRLIESVSNESQLMTDKVNDHSDDNRAEKAVDKKAVTASDIQTDYGESELSTPGSSKEVSIKGGSQPVDRSAKLLTDEKKGDESRSAVVKAAHLDKFSQNHQPKPTRMRNKIDTVPADSQLADERSQGAPVNSALRHKKQPVEVKESRQVKPKSITVKGIDEAGLVLFDKVINSADIQTWLQQHTGYYGYDFQRSRYDQEKNCYLLQYQRSQVTVKVINLDEEGHQLSTDHLSGKFGDELDYQPLPIAGYQPTISSKKIALSTLTPADIIIRYLPVNNNQVKKQLPIDMLVEGTAKPLSKTTANSVTEQSKQPDSKPAQADRQGGKQAFQDGKRKSPTTNRNSRKVAAGSKKKVKGNSQSAQARALKRRLADKSRQKARVTASEKSDTATPALTERVGKTAVGHRLPQTGDSDGSRGIICGIGLLLTLLTSFFKKRLG